MALYTRNNRSRRIQENRYNKWWIRSSRIWIQFNIQRLSSSKNQHFRNTSMENETSYSTSRKECIWRRINRRKSITRRKHGNNRKLLWRRSKSWNNNSSKCKPKTSRICSMVKRKWRIHKINCTNRNRCKHIS